LWAAIRDYSEGKRIMARKAKNSRQKTKARKAVKSATKRAPAKNARAKKAAA